MSMSVVAYMEYRQYTVEHMCICVVMIREIWATRKVGFHFLVELAGK